jgi:predicted enzyme related to lactoylglutathione lyase
MNLNGIMIGSENPKVLAEYYTKLFGKPGMQEDEYSGWEMGNGYLTVYKHGDVSGKNASPGRLMWYLETADVEGESARLTAAGATVVKEPYHPGEAPEMWVATFSDPDGNYFQLMSPM